MHLQLDSKRYENEMAAYKKHCGNAAPSPPMQKKAKRKQAAITALVA